MEDLVYWVWLSRVFDYASLKPRELLSFFKDAKDIYEADEREFKNMDFLRATDFKSLKRTSLQTAKEIIAECKEKNIDITPYNSEDYPIRLRNIINPPMVIYSVGNISKIDEDVCLAVVGTRKASDYGKRLTGNMCYELAKAGMVIVSGCAVGIDSYAHLGALKAGGKTIGVLACGIDVNYPLKSEKLKLAILKKGALISEMPPGEKCSRTIFAARNRLMSALCNGVMVTEAPLRSGSLITAEHAIEQGRDLFCVPPHDIYSENFSGVSKYIRDGAIPVCSAKDILFEYINSYPHKLYYEMIFNNFINYKPKTKKDFDLGRKTKKSTNNIDKDDIINKGESENKTKTSPDIVDIPDIIDSVDIETQYPNQEKLETSQGESQQEKNQTQQETQKAIEDRLKEENLKMVESYGQEYVNLYNTLTKEPMPVEFLADQIDIPISKVLVMLTELELLRLINVHSGARFSI